MLSFEEIRRAVGPGAEVVAPGLAQPLLENARDFPVFRMDVAHRREAKMGYVLHHQKNGAVVDAGAEPGAARGPIIVLVVAERLHSTRLQIELE